ncbi:MAG: hypothetical protein KC486_06595, partial [Myxococcales bacterium]|nr:hypothetical protein [Myxococcales bacterium]
APAGATPAARSIYLDPGRWSVETRAKGYVSQPQDVVIGKKDKTVDGRNFVLALDPKLRQVSLRIDVPADAQVEAVEVELRSTTDSSAPPQRCTIRPFEVNECRLLTEIGTWEVTASAPGFKPFHQVITLTSGQNPASYTLPLASETPVAVVPPPEVEPEKVDVVPKPVRMRVAGALNASGLPIFVTGLGLAVYGSNTYDRAINTDVADCTGALDNYNCRNDTIKAIRLRTAGLALIGTATGLFTTGLTAEFDVKPRVWYAEMGVGGGLLLGGAIWLGATTASLNRELMVTEPPPWDQSVPNIDKATNQRLAGAMLMGTGIGLVTGSTVGLLIRKRYERRAKPLKSAKLSPFAPMGGGGLMLSGRF